MSLLEGIRRIFAVIPLLIYAVIRFSMEIGGIKEHRKKAQWKKQEFIKSTRFFREYTRIKDELAKEMENRENKKLEEEKEIIKELKR